MLFTQYSRGNLAGVYETAVVERSTARDHVSKAGSHEPWLPSRLFTKCILNLLSDLFNADPHWYATLLHSVSLREAREQMVAYLNQKESAYFEPMSPERLVDSNITERANAKECIRVLKNILRTENEERTGFSALQAHGNRIRSAVAIFNERVADVRNT